MLLSICFRRHISLLVQRLNFYLATKNLIILTIILFLSIVVGVVFLKEVNDGMKTLDKDSI